MIRNSKFLGGMLLFLGFFTACSDNASDMDDIPYMGESKSFALMSRADASVSGMAVFEENADGSTTVTLDLNGTTSGMLPAHIHFNSAAEGGDIAVSLNPVDGATGMSVTMVSALDDGMPITYAQLLAFDGYINVHQSMDNLATLMAQGDIGINELTETSITYDLGSRDVEGISGSLVLTRRVSGATLAEIRLEGTPDGGMHPGHIHMNSAAEGGDIAFTFNAVDGTSGMSQTHIEALNSGAPISYEELLAFDGYVNIHLSADDLGTLVAQGDIGRNDLTGESKAYALDTRDRPGVQGTATFFERVSGNSLLVVQLEGTPADGMHPGHVHMDNAVTGGGIALTLETVVGATGRSETDVETLDDGTPVSYMQWLDFDGYINIHESADNLGSLIAQGDIGQNELTGQRMIYPLVSVSDPTIFGTATFRERVNAETLVEVALQGTQDGDSHPSHIHMGSVDQAPGTILISLGAVSGATGMLQTNVTMLDDQTPISYEQMVVLDAYLNVHLSAEDLATLVAQGDVGINAQ
ncbi:CHRD domain-containing protein [Robiginitalea sp. M366]|uniref:CHRD domain-containing protein n=1 Tax=Robiginitalea aestuariiviva TaxID=3036903 RepID=UPI00240E011B|nr:CHRD domain-containing protein [Robiginitalea aestuariiviva]MDG1572644.1 CHRD domain-containing protein [Robiginitalea aestuariiviva]